ELFQRPLELLELALDEAPAQLDGLALLFLVDEMPDLVPRAARDDGRQPVARGSLPGRGQDLDDVAALERRPQGDELAVHAGPDAPVADVGVHPVGEIDGGRAAGGR